MTILMPVLELDKRVQIRFGTRSAEFIFYPPERSFGILLETCGSGQATIKMAALLCEAEALEARAAEITDCGFTHGCTRPLRVRALTMVFGVFTSHSSEF